jgi:Phage tail tube protein
MAAAVTFSAGKLLLLVGDGESSEAFTEPCAITEASITISKELADTIIPDCSDPDAVGWVERDATSNSATISISGMVTSAGNARFNELVLETASANMKPRLVGGGTGSGTPDLQWSGKWHVTSYEFKRARGERLTFSAEIVSDGTITSSSVAALS